MIEMTLDSGRRIVVVRMTGTIGDADLLAARDASRTDPLFPPGFRQLIDLTGVSEFDVSSAAAQSLAPSSSVAPGTKRAIVAPSDIAFGASRVFAVYAERYGHDVQVFRDADEAMRWLDE